MQRKTIIGALLAAIATLAVAPIGGAPAKSSKVTEMTCTLELYAQGAPNLSGIQFGFARCPKPFGRGLHFSEITVNSTGAGTGTVVAAFKNFYNRGTTRGTAALTYAATGPGTITYSGTVAYTRGTGKFKHVRGHGTIRCTTTDGGAHKTCTVDSELTGLSLRRRAEEGASVSSPTRRARASATA